MSIVPTSVLKNLPRKDIFFPLVNQEPPVPAQEPREILSFSPLINDLLSQNIDLANTKAILINETLSFELSFQDISVQNLSLNGIYQEKNQTLSLEMSFTANIGIIDAQTQTVRLESYQFQLEIKASFIQIQEQKTDIQPQDIPSFARGLAKAIGKLRAKGKDINGLELKDKDLLALVGYDQKKLLHLLRRILAIAKMITKLSSPSIKGQELSFKEEFKQLEISLKNTFIKLNITPASKSND